MMDKDVQCIVTLATRLMAAVEAIACGSWPGCLAAGPGRCTPENPCAACQARERIRRMEQVIETANIMLEFESFGDTEAVSAAIDELRDRMAALRELPKR